MKVLSITAHLRNGFIAANDWSPALENILAYWHLKETQSDAEFAAGCANIDDGIVIDDLPLEIERFNDDWWYKASSPITEVSMSHGVYINRRFDQLHAERHMLPKRGRVQTQTGQHKNKRGKFQVSITDRVVWHVVGDEKEIRRLLNKCSHIGAQTSRGYGKIKSWEITDDGDIETARFKRPLPAEFAEIHNIDGSIHMTWGYRPHVRRRRNQTLCIMP